MTHILTRHPAVAPFIERIRDVLAHPEEIRRSTYDPQILLFSRFYSDLLAGKHLVAVVRTDGRWFIVTVYVARRLAGGGAYEGEGPVLI